MQRPIKFRAFHKELRDSDTVLPAWMEYNPEWGQYASRIRTETHMEPGHIDPTITSVAQARINDIFTSGTAPLMQYIGLKDKNGKEIYEGDVLQHIGVEQGKCEVAWAQITLSWCLRYEDGVDSNFPTDLAMEMKGKRRRDLEIIGNIYESPDLLTSK
jgi:uncharacterized phage protein (TIGR01671 family)